MKPEERTQIAARLREVADQIEAADVVPLGVLLAVQWPNEGARHTLVGP